MRLHHILILAICAPVPCEAQAAEEFFAGKQIQLLVSSEPGTVYDSYARLVARHIGEHMPGQPRVLAQNMPGGGGLRVANYIANIAPRDGSVFAATHNAVLTMSLVTPDAAKFNEREFSWIGSVTRDPYLAVVRADVPVATIEDAKTKTISMGAASAGSLGAMPPQTSSAPSATPAAT